MRTVCLFGLVVGVASCSASGGSCGAYRDLVSLPADGTVRPATVPLDIAWETPLIVYSGGSPAPMGIHDATASCVPASQCVARVVQPFVENDDPKLVVVGLAAGPASVLLRYFHPARNETLTARLHFVFLPAEDLPEVDVGVPLKSAPFLFKHVPDDFKNRMSSGAPATSTASKEISARCEGSISRPASTFTCFPLESSGGSERRYPSCDHSTRCSTQPGGIVVDGFTLCVESEDGDRIVTGMRADTSLSEGPAVKALGEWGKPTDACKPSMGTLPR